MVSASRGSAAAGASVVSRLPNRATEVTLNPFFSSRKGKRKDRRARKQNSTLGRWWVEKQGRGVQGTLCALIANQKHNICSGVRICSGAADAKHSGEWARSVKSSLSQADIYDGHAFKCMYVCCHPIPSTLGPQSSAFGLGRRTSWGCHTPRVLPESVSC